MSSLAIHGQPVIYFAEECEHATHRGENEVSVLHVRLALADLILVADGSCGKVGGAFAARMASEYVYAHLAGYPPDYPVDSAIREAAARANAGLLAASSAPGSSLQGMRASLVVALLQQEGEITYAWIGHIGNCRAYLMRAGRLHPVTVDHSVVQEELHRKLITPFEALHHPEAGVLTRSLGQQYSAEIEIEQLPIAVGDTLLLCSAGLWQAVPEQEIQEAAISATVDSAARNLLALALSSGGPGTIGIEVARLVLPPDSSRSREHPPVALGVILTVFLVALTGVAALIWFLL
jgi:protein phosphatase